jgi:hypothetical protein
MIILFLVAVVISLIGYALGWQFDAVRRAVIFIVLLWVLVAGFTALVIRAAGEVPDDAVTVDPALLKP